MGIFRISIIAFSLTLLVACGKSSLAIGDRDPIHWTLDKATEEEKQLAIERVLDELKDPDSAKFGDIWALRGSNGILAVCGYVDYKNFFGEYVGETMFSAKPYGSPEQYPLMASHEIFGKLFPKICQERTVE